MRVLFDHENQASLLEAYAHVSAAIHGASEGLGPLLLDAAELVPSTRTTHLQCELEAVATALEFDARDLERRGDFIQQADARLAARIDAQAGDIVNISLAQDAVSNGWTYREAELRHELSSLRALPRAEQIRRASEIRVLEDTLAIVDAPHSVAGMVGDDEADLIRHRINPPLRLTQTEATDRGRALVSRALYDTSDPNRILQDEFSAILHDNGNLTLVLPGVTDLSSPDLGYNDEHRSYRDVDQEAWNSSRSTDLEDNGYARRVWTWVALQIANGVIEIGANTTIIGHSFGGDTALDLSADRDFNGGLVNVTHAVPMAYHNEPQFDAVPEHTHVLALQNIWDAPVFAESINADAWQLATEGHTDQEAVGTVARAGIEGAEAASDGVIWLVNESVDRIEGAVEEQWGPSISVPNIPNLELKHDDYRVVTHHITLAEFEGAFDGVGHHQSNYQAFLDRADHDEVLTFWQSLDDHGFSDDGVSVAIDVSKPN